MSLLDTLAAHGPVLLLGTTALLAAGVGAVLSAGQPIDRLRRAQLAVGACLLYLPLALVPLPRVLGGPPPVWDADGTTVADVPRAALPDVDPAGRGSPELRPGATRREAGSRDRGPGRGAVRAGGGEEGAVLPVPTSAGERPSGARPPQASVEPATDAATPATPSGTAPVPWGIPRVLAATWASGALAVLLWLGLGAVRLRRLLRHAGVAGHDVKVPPVRGRPVRLLAVGGPCRPFCCGLLQPTVVVPAVLLAPERRRLLRRVVAHEHAHLCQGDPWSAVLFAAALPLLFFHPLFWWLRRRARRAAECLADDRAAAPGERTAYARDLLELAAVPALRVPAPAATVAVFSRRSELRRRIEMLLDRTDRLAARPRHGRLHTLAAVALLLATATLWGSAPAPAQEPRSSEPAARAGKEGNFLGELPRLSDRFETQDPGTGPAPDSVAELRKERDRLARRVAILERKLAEIQETARAYTVQKGDEPWRIMRKVGGFADLDRFVHRLRVLNPELDLGKLQVGDRIRVPVVDRGGAEPVVLPGSAPSPGIRSTSSSEGSPETSPPRPDGTRTDSEAEEALAVAPSIPQEAEPEEVASEELRAGPAAVPARDAGAVAGVRATMPRTTRVGGDDGHLLDLLTRRIDLRGAVREARSRCEELQPAVEAGVATTQEYERARIGLETAEHKLALVDRMVRLRLEGAREDLSHTRQMLARLRVLHENGAVTMEEVAEQELRLRSLERRIALLKSVR